jgi:hypothetical protein
MRIKSRLLGVCAIAALSMFSAPGASAFNLQLFAELVGGHESPPGDPNGYGTAAVSFRGAGLTTVCVTLYVENIDTPTLAHIHFGYGSTAAGGIVITLTPPSSGGPGFSTGCHATSSAIANALQNTPYAFYVNVHNEPFPAGAVRGQLF